MMREEILNKFKSIRVLVIGDSILDRYFKGSAERISPEAPVPVVNITSIESRLGGAANVALNVKRLGADVTLISVLSKDEAGKTLISLLKKNRIGTSGILISPPRKTTVKSRVISSNHQLLRFDEEVTDDLSNQEVKLLLKTLKNEIAKRKPDIVIYEDYNKGVLSKEFINSSIALLQKNNISFVVDPKKKNFFEFKHALLFKPNLREVKEAMNIFAGDIASLNKAAVTLRKKTNNQFLMVTLSDKGVYYHDGKAGYIIPAQIRNVSDVSGAGDTVIATAALSIAAQLTLHDTMSLANIAGGLVCEEAGVVPVNKEKLLKEFIRLQ